MKEFYADKIAVVTGGASGIGLAMTELMLGFEAAVIIADINETKLNTETAWLAEHYPGKIFGKKTDISKADEVDALEDYAVEKGGRLDFMFNTAGLPLLKPIVEITTDDGKFAFDVNFYGALYGTLAALHGLTLALRAECWDEHIFLHSVIPGTVATPIWAGGQVPEGAFTPEESARTIIVLPEHIRKMWREYWASPQAGESFFRERVRKIRSIYEASGSRRSSE